MAEPIKIKFDYQSPDNVEAEVPGAQSIREANRDENNGENETADRENETKDEPTTEVISSYREVRREVVMVDDGQVVTRSERVMSKEDGAPITLEDKQSVEDKKPKTKIPVSRFRQTVEKVKADRRGSENMKEIESHIPVRRSSIPKPVKKDFKAAASSIIKEKKVTKVENKTETFDTKSEVKKETRNAITKDRKESAESKTEVKNETTAFTEEKKKISSQTVITKEMTEPEDEFDKIYEEMAVSTPTPMIIDDLLNTKEDDPDVLESKFEDLIHDYDENKIHPIDIEQVRRSKIPFLKRRSQQEFDESTQADRTSKIIAAREKIRLRHSLSKTETLEQDLDRELKKAGINCNESSDNISNENTNDAVIKTKSEQEIKHAVVTSPNTTEVTHTVTRIISTSSTNDNEDVGSSNIVETTTVTEVKTNEVNDVKEDKKGTLVEENLIKDTIKIGIPVFDSYVHEYSENDESIKTVEVKRALSYISRNEDLTSSISESKSEILVNTTDYNTYETEIVEIKDFTDEKSDTPSDKSDITNSKDKKETIIATKTVRERDDSVEKEVQLRGKVERLKTNIDTKELVETNIDDKGVFNDVPKKKSIMSKIAMFERVEVESSVKSRIPRKETKLRELVRKDIQNEEHVHVHTPLIVHEVFKPFQSKIDHSKELNNVGTPNNSNKKATNLTNGDVQANGDPNNVTNKIQSPAKDNVTVNIMRTENVIVDSPDRVLYGIENKVEVETKTFEQSQVVEEVSAPSRTVIESEYTVQRAEIATMTCSPINANNEHQNELKQVKDEIKDATKVAKINAPVIIPYFRRVSERLKDFEAMSDSHNVKTQQATPELKKEERLATVTDIQSNIRPVTEILSFDVCNNEIHNKNGTGYRTDTENDNIIQNCNENINKVDNSIQNSIENNKIDKSFIEFDEVFIDKSKLKRDDDIRRAKSLAELDLGNAVKGKVTKMIIRMNSVDKIELDKKEVNINIKEMPRKRSVSEKIALFEGKLTPSRSDSPLPLRIYKLDKNTLEIQRTEQKIETQTEELTNKKNSTESYRTQKSVVARCEKEKKNAIVLRSEERSGTEVQNGKSEEEVQRKIEDLRNAKVKYGRVDNVPNVELSNGMVMPAIAVGTAQLDPRLVFHVIAAAIDLGYRSIDTAFIYGNEKEVGEAIRAKIADGTVRREDLFVTSKLWSTYHRSDLVEDACRASLDAMGLDYFDLYLIHNPMSFKEGKSPIPKIATVIQYSEHDYLEAWYGMERLVSKGLVKAIGVSNFNSVQLQRVLDKGRIKPVVNQVECHPYLSQQRLDLFCSERNVTLMCFGALGSKGTPQEYRGTSAAVIDDALVQVMASGLGITPAQLLIRYQLESGHAVIVKASSASHLWDNLQSANTHLSTVQVDALHALNRNKRIFTFKGMGDTHRNYPFNIGF